MHNRRMNLNHPLPAANPNPDWHALSADDALAHHGVHPDHGLTEEEAAARLARHGPNRPASSPGAARWRASSPS
jgi:cation-transporting ATPase F